CMIMAQCSQNIDIINNEFDDCWSQGVQLQSNAFGFCDTRPVDNVNILRNVFRNTRALASGACCANFIKLQGAQNGIASSAYVNNVTIADNFFSTTQTGDAGYTSAILSSAGRNGASIPGTIKIVNNTFDGNYQGNRSCGCTRGAVATNNEDGGDTLANNYIIKDNVF